MKRLLRLLALFFLAPLASATTSVTGTMQNLGTGAATPNAFMRFWLRGCAGNQPRVSGTALIAPTQGGVFYFDFPANASGLVSGTLYSTRDVTGNNGGDIQCGTSTTAAWYGMQAFYGGKGGPEVAVHAKNTTTLDITQVVAITTNPVVTSPTGDSTYARLDGGNQPFLANVTPSGNGTLNLGSTANRWNVNAAALNANGTSTVTNFNKIIYVDGTKYATPEAAIAACPAAPTGCHVYVAQGNWVSAGFTIGVSPSQNNYAQIVELDPGARIYLTGKITVLSGGQVVGDMRDGSSLIACTGTNTPVTGCSAFPASTPLVDLGDNVNLVASRIDNVAINANSITGSTCIRGRGLNENSGGSRILCQNYLTNGILVDGSTVNTANFMFSDLQILAATGAADAIKCNVCQTGTFMRVTVGSNSGAAITGAGIYSTGSSGSQLFVWNYYVEKHSDALKVDNGSLAAFGVSAGNGTVNTLHVAAGALSVEAWHLRNNGNSGALPVVQNDITSNTIGSQNPPTANGVVAFYTYQTTNNVETWQDVNGLHNTNKPFLAAGGINISSTVAGDGSGFKHKRGAVGCATAASAGATCTTTLSWTTAFPDTSYTPHCIGDGVTSGVPLDGGITAKAAASVTFQTVAGTAAAAQYTAIDCSAQHD